MSDLISRSELYNLPIYKFGVSMLSAEEYIKVSDIEKMPTAYDIDKVVEELEKATQYIKIDGKPTSVKAIHPEQAIEIVKQGGVSDDVCEWRKHSICGFYSEHEGAVRIINIADGFKYCPYCGKKIKVVE